MTDTITITGTVGTDPRQLTTGAGLAITSFRLASTLRRFDRQLNKWVDGDTNWYTVTTFRQLAVNVAASIKRGERVVVVGRVRIKDWQTTEKSGTTVDIEADALGHDLTWGTTAFTRVSIASTVGAEPAAGQRPDADADADADAGAADAVTAADDAESDPGFPGAERGEGALPAAPASVAGARSFDDLLTGDGADRESVPF